MKDRLKDLQENVRFILFLKIEAIGLSTISLKIEKYDDGIDISIINHFAVIDMEAPIMDNFFNQVIVFKNDQNPFYFLIRLVQCELPSIKSSNLLLMLNICNMRCLHHKLSKERKRYWKTKWLKLNH